MKITLTYTFYGMDECDCTTPSDWEPHYRMGISEIEYEYECDLRITDIIDYYATEKRLTKEQFEGYAMAIKDMIDQGFIDPSMFSEDDGFMDCLRETHEDDAFEQFSQEYEGASQYDPR